MGFVCTAIWVILASKPGLPRAYALYVLITRGSIFEEGLDDFTT